MKTSELLNRIKELADLKMEELKRQHPDLCQPENKTEWRCIKDSRGQCIVAILLEEFELLNVDQLKEDDNDLDIGEIN